MTEKTVWLYLYASPLDSSAVAAAAKSKWMKNAQNHDNGGDVGGDFLETDEGQLADRLGIDGFQVVGPEWLAGPNADMPED